MCKAVLEACAARLDQCVDDVILMADGRSIRAVKVLTLVELIVAAPPSPQTGSVDAGMFIFIESSLLSPLMTLRFSTSPGFTRSVGASAIPDGV